MAAEFQITGEYDATIKTILSSARHTELSIPTEQRLNLVGHLLKHMHQHHDSEPEVWHDVSDTKSAQAAADAVYSPAYQKRKIKKDASLDIHGRPVRYYRYVSVDDLFHILRDGEDNPLRHHKNPFSLVESGKPNDPNFRDFLEKVIESKNMPEVDRDEPITSLLYKAFPQVNKATLDKMFGVRGPAADWKRIFLFFEKHVDVAVLKKAHAVGSWLKEYSPFMSVNPGGPTRRTPETWQPYLELIIPDNEVMLNENNRSIMEREAVTRKIRAEWISRIFFDEDIFRLDVLQNPQTPIGAYSNAHPDRSELVNHREWMFNERVEETLPVSLVTKTE